MGVQTAFDLTPAGIITELDLQRPIYARTAVGGHFGREDFPWEKLDRTGLLMANPDLKWRGLPKSRSPPLGG